MWQRNHHECTLHARPHPWGTVRYLHRLIPGSFNAQGECVLVHVFKLGIHNTFTCSVSLYITKHCSSVQHTLHLDDVDEDRGEAVECGATPHCLEVGAEGSKQGQSHLQGATVAILRRERGRRERMGVLP